MSKLRLICSTFLFLIGSFSPASAQNENPKIENSPSTALTVTALVSNERLRITAPASVVQMRLEVYNSSGRKLFDNELRGGNILDWHLLDGQAQPLSDDTYLCLVTVKNLSGRISQRIGALKIEQQTARMQSQATNPMTPQQAETIGPIEENAYLTILEAEPKQTTTVLAHDGLDGQITRGQGALSFRLGDFYSGKDTEQMRLTAEGNLGIGTSQPQARLDVAGTIRASGGIVFPDGSIQYSASSKTLGAKSAGPGQKRESGQEFAPNASGTGTQNRIALWIDSAGTLGDANIFETTGAIGINASPDTRFRLDVNGSTRLRGSNPGFNLEGLRPAGNIWLFQTVDTDGRFRLFSQDNVNPGVERLTIGLSTGNVGIGNTSPTARLDVEGTINTSTQYNIGGQRVLSIGGANNLFAGVGAGSVTTGSANAFFGSFAGFANTNGFNNSFFGSNAGANHTTGIGNSFFGANAGSVTTTGDSNSFFGAGAGLSNTVGSNNVFFGNLAGLNNTTGNDNTFVGTIAGRNNTTAHSNAFFGRSSGQENTTGSQNAFFGAFSGFTNSTGSDNSFFGRSTGFLNSTGMKNSFFGSSAGNTNTTGSGNSFFGASAGLTNSTGSDNAFFGKDAGMSNTTGPSNNFFGRGAGQANTVGSGNGFFGTQAGWSNTMGHNNNFFGGGAGQSNIDGSDNAFFGDEAGFSNTTGSNNAFFGNLAGSTNTTGSNNTVIGGLANVASNNLSNAAAIGALAQVSQSNSLVLGSINGVNNATADTSVGIGTTAPKERLHVQGGNLYLGGAGQGIILKSPDGSTCRLLTIDNSGGIVLTLVSCP
jgi:hypothetical protein